MNLHVPKLASAALCVMAFLMGRPAHAQQFNSDNYLSKPHGMATLIVTAGEQTTMFMTTVSLFPKWELTAAAYLHNKDDDRKTGEGSSGSLFAKYMIHENKLSWEIMSGASLTRNHGENEARLGAFTYGRKFNGDQVRASRSASCSSPRRSRASVGASSDRRSAHEDSADGVLAERETRWLRVDAKSESSAVDRLHAGGA